MTENAIPNGTRINERYVISEVIGEGGGGIVYKAFDVNLQSYVVVKQIKDNMSSLLESRTEVDALKRLKHERLPKVLDFFEAEGKVYTVMDLIQGTNLSTALRFQGRYLQKDVLRWARQLAGALAYLHSQTPPVIHSDIKPGNIMMNPQTGDVCLIDFNISLAFNKRNVNATWVSGGYSPPEQYRSLEDYYRYIETARRQQTQSPYTRSRVYQGSMAELTEIGAVSRKKYLFNLGTPVSLGAGADCSLCLNYRGVAGHHCELFLHGADACARSLSGCRTILQRGGRSSEIAPGGVFVKNGDRLMLGEAIVEIRLLKA